MIENKRNIQAEEINKFIKYFTEHYFNDKNTKLINSMIKSLALIIQAEAKTVGLEFSLNSEDNNDLVFELKDDKKGFWAQRMTCDKIKGEDGRYKDEKPKISINTGRLYSNLNVISSEGRINACKRLLQGIFHEFQHYRQYTKTQSTKSSKESLDIGREWAISDSGIINSKLYSQNHDEFFIEMDADTSSFLEYKEVMNEEFSGDQGEVFNKKLKKVFSKCLYDSDGENGKFYERRDIITKVIEEAITEQGKTDLLLMYPILQKEYNIDGTKKDTKQLMTDMKLDLAEISGNDSLTDVDKNKAIIDSKEMYYELIYRQLQMSDKGHIGELFNDFGEDEINHLISEMIVYFQDEKGRKIEAVKNENIVSDAYLPFNSIKRHNMIESGNGSTLSKKEFFDSLDKDKLERGIPFGENKKRKAIEILEGSFYRYIPQSGRYVLKDGTIITAKDFIENYFIEQYEYTGEGVIPESIEKYLSQVIMSNGECEKIILTSDIEKYYDTKISLLNEIGKDKLSQLENNRDNSEISQGRQASSTDGRMQFVQRFLDLYDNTETEYQQETRLELESGTIKRVLDIVGKKGMQISDLIDVRYIDIDETGKRRPEYTAKQFSAMARLLKAAEVLNNDKDVNPNGVNYLEQFTAVPQIKNILLAMSQDFKYEGTYLYQLRDEYKKSKSVGDISDSSSLEEVSDDETKVSHKLNKTMGTTYKQRAQQQAKTSSQSFRESVAPKSSRTIPQKAQPNRTASQRFRESVSNDTTKQGISEESQQQTKTSSQSFRDSLYKARTIEKTGITDVKKTQNDMALRKERGKLVRESVLGQLDEDGKRRLEEINRLLNIKNINVQQYEANKRKQGHGQSR